MCLTCALIFFTSPAASNFCSCNLKLVHTHVTTELRFPQTSVIMGYCSPDVQFAIPHSGHQQPVCGENKSAQLILLGVLCYVGTTRLTIKTTRSLFKQGSLKKTGMSQQKLIAVNMAVMYTVTHACDYGHYQHGKEVWHIHGGRVWLAVKDLGLRRWWWPANTLLRIHTLAGVLVLISVVQDQ